MTLPAGLDPGVPASRSLDVAALQNAVLGWYRANARPLAFRGTSDPWAILVSEFMAQQTQAARAADAWLRFIDAYPTPSSFAAASPADALRAWRGLGYNRRALALHRTARALVDEHAGRVPADIAALERLPGIGPYTARAVASLAFDLPVGAVDTNVRRVLGRALFDAAADGEPGRRDVQAAADGLVPADRPGEWTHALMDVGATFCRPRSPRCAACPIQPWCRYAAATAAGAEPPARPTAVRVGASRPTPFESTARWLRGRILGRVLDAEGSSWVVFDGSMGGHDRAAIVAALRSMAADGLVEIRGESPPEARLPTAR